MPFRTWAMGPAVLRPYSRSPKRRSRAGDRGWVAARVRHTHGPLYRRMLRDQFGFAREVDALLGAIRSGGPLRLPAAAERLVQDVADTIDLVLPLGFPDEQLREMLEAIAPATASSVGKPRRAARLPPGPAPQVQPYGQLQDAATHRWAARRYSSQNDTFLGAPRLGAPSRFHGKGGVCSQAGWAPGLRLFAIT